MQKLRGREAIGRVSGVSLYNFEPEVRNKMNLPPRVVVKTIKVATVKNLFSFIIFPFAQI